MIVENQTKKLLAKLRVDENSVLFTKIYSRDVDNKTLNKLKKSNYAKDKIFYKLYRDFQETRIKLPKTKVLNTPFVEEKRTTQHGDMLKTVDGPMQFFYADVACLSFFSKSVVAPKYCLVCVDLFTSKTNTYRMKRKSQLPAKLESVFLEIQDIRVYLKKENRCRMRLKGNLKSHRSSSWNTTSVYSKKLKKLAKNIRDSAKKVTRGERKS